MILIDYSPVLISCAHSAVTWQKKRDKLLEAGKFVSEDEKNTKVEDVHMFRMLNTLRMVNSMNRRKYGRPIVCVDRKPYWRSEVFPNYKKNRKPMDRTMDWSMFFDNGEDILNACRDVFGWKVIDIPGIEADDSIGVIVHNIRDEDHMIISPDGDFKQLQIYKNVSQYDSIHNKKVVEKYPEQWLRFKIITGDKKDGIPNIVSDKDTFMTEGMRQTSISSQNKKSWSAASNPMFFCTGDMLERYKFNEELLDMSKVPEKQTKQILDELKVPANKPGNLYGYFASKGISRFIDSLGDFK